MQLPTPEGLYTLSTVYQVPSRQLDSVLDLLLPIHGPIVSYC